MPQYPHLLTVSAFLMLASLGSAQTAAPATPAADAVAPWDRPADGPAMFTEDFESGDINPKIWVQRVSGGPTLTVEHDVVAHGKSALHVHYPAGTGSRSAWAFLGMTMYPQLVDHFYGRAYVMIKGISQTHSVFLLSGSVGFPIADFLEIGTDRGKFQPSFQLNAPTADRLRGEATTQTGLYPMNRWFCLEWEFSDKPDRIVIWVDGKLTVNHPLVYQIVKPNGPKVDTGLTGGFKEFDFGFRTWANPQPTDVDVYYDDIAISDKPIGQLTPVSDAPTPAASGAAK